MTPDEQSVILLQIEDRLARLEKLLEEIAWGLGIDPNKLSLR